MATSTGIELAQSIRLKIEDLKKVCAGVDENMASRAPVERWSPKEILSHLLGPEGTGRLAIFQAFLTAETPTITMHTANPFFSEKRAKMTFAQILSEVEREYEDIARFAEGLSPEQLDRKAHIPALKESPLGEYPTLGAFLGGVGGYHVQFHVDHMREILQALGAPAK